MTEQKKRGRKPIGNAPMTAAERKRRQRAMMTAAGIRTINVTLTEYAEGIVKQYCEITGISEMTHLSIIASISLDEWAKDAERRWPEIVENINALKQAKEQRND